MAVAIRMPAGHVPRRLTPSGDERLARLVQAGDDRAFATLYERYHQQLFRYCRSMVRDEADAQDALQSALTNALVALRAGRRDAPVRPWLYRIAHNESISLMRRRRGHLGLSEASELPTGALEEQVEQRERLASLVADLRELPERQRGALMMHELAGLSHEEIASALEVSGGVARQLVYEARRSLQEFAEGRAMQCDEICRLISDGDRRALRARRVRAHMRGCAACNDFSESIRTRSADLRALYPPLPAAAAAGILGHLLGGSSGHAGGGASGVAAAGAGSAGKTLGVALSTKALAGIATVAVATAGVGTAVTITRSEPHRANASQASAARAAVGAAHAALAGGAAGRHPATSVASVAPAVHSGRSHGHGAAERSANKTTSHGGGVSGANGLHGGVASAPGQTGTMPASSQASANGSSHGAGAGSHRGGAGGASGTHSTGKSNGASHSATAPGKTKTTTAATGKGKGSSSAGSNSGHSGGGSSKTSTTTGKKTLTNATSGA